MLFAKPVASCWQCGRADDSRTGEEQKSCCLQQEMFWRTEWYRRKLQRIPPKQEMNLNMKYK